MDKSTKERWQKIFNRVYTFLHLQGGPAYDDGCKYRTNGGRKCAVGCLIPENKYQVEMEEKSVSDLLAEGLLPSKWNDDKELLIRLQDTHDNIRNYNYEGKWKPGFYSDMNDLAKQFDLKVPEVTTRN